MGNSYSIDIVLPTKQFTNQIQVAVESLAIVKPYNISKFLQLRKINIYTGTNFM